MMHVINWESGGDPSAVGDGGIAIGLAQSHYLPRGASPRDQIADAWRLVSANPDQWTDWGEGSTYQGKPFGALGNMPYDGGFAGGAVRSGYATSGGTATGERMPTEEGGIRGKVARLVVQKRLDAEQARSAAIDEEARAKLETSPQSVWAPASSRHRPATRVWLHHRC
jgi:hypothetical protein